jgi:hypothetical protein
MRKQKKIKHAMTNPIRRLRTKSSLASMFLSIFCNGLCGFFELEPDANEGQKKTGSKTQTNGREGGRERMERGPDAGAQVSGATQKTCTSDIGTGVCTTSSPRHDSSDGKRQWQGGV